MDNCKDVDVVSVLPECSTSTTADSLGSEMVSDRRLMDNSNGTTVNSRARNQRDPSLDYDIGYDGMTASPSIFEFQKGERVQQRVSIAPFSKPAPSKWDDAQKWIASPTSNRPKAAGQGVGSRKVSRQLSTKVVVEVPDQKAVAFDEPDTKQIDMNQTKLESWGQNLVPWEADACPTTESYSKPVLMIENSVGESASKHLVVLIFCCHNSSDTFLLFHLVMYTYCASKLKFFIFFSFLKIRRIIIDREEVERRTAFAV